MTIEVTAKKVDDAIKQGLDQLGVSIDEVQVEILESGGLFRKAKVRLTLDREEQPEKEPEKASPAAAKEPPVPQKKEAPIKQEPAEAPKKKESAETSKQSEKPAEQKPRKEKTEQKPQSKKAPTEKPAAPKQEKPAEKTEQQSERPVKNSEEIKQAVARATEFITGLIEKMGFEGVTVESAENGDVAITAPAGDDSLIIGRHGETLSAISFLAETLGRAEKQHVNIVADCNGYRERRAASLTAMAKRRANEAVSKHRKIKLEPMERVDRRTIHNALSTDDRVTTLSEGKEPYRYIVIIPKK